MINYGLMAVFVLMLTFFTVYKAKFHSDGNQGFFDLENSGALRGIFSLIILMIHVPLNYQNKIQLMIGGFAYIGVTYFFLTSAYGLTMKTKKNPESIRTFWRTRLPKILVPQYLCNIIFTATALLTNPAKISFNSIFGINIWVVWLLIFYFVFWLTHLLIKKSTIRYGIIFTFVVALSLTGFYIRTKVIPDFLIWTPEMYGLIAGTLLALFYDIIKSFFTSKWTAKVIVGGMITLLMGVLYLKTQDIVFWGNYVLKTILGITIIAFILLINSKISISNKTLNFLSKISFEIYLTHINVMEAVEHLFPTLTSSVYIMLCIIITIIFSTLIHLAGKKILNILYSKIPCFQQ